MGAVIAFSAYGIEWICTLGISGSANAENAKEWMKGFYLVPKFFGISFILLLFPGLYLTINTWGWTSWILFSLAGLLYLTISGKLFVGKKVIAIAEELEKSSGNLSVELKSKIAGSNLFKTIVFKTFVGLGIVFLMTMKTQLFGTITSSLIFLFIGVIAANLPLLRPVKQKKQTVI